MADSGHILARIGQLADRQHGHVTRGQLLELGWPERTISHRIRQHDLIVVHAGVYALGHVERHALARAHAAVLACGDHAVLSHESALALWDLREWPRTPEVTTPSRRARPGIITHRSRTLSGDTRTRHGVRATSPVRTIIDVAPARTDRQLTRLVNDARLKKHLNATALSRLPTRSPRIRRLIDPSHNPTRSPLEDDFVAWLTRHDLPMPQLNVILNGYEVDALYPDQRLIIELDSWTYHRSKHSFDRDHERDATHRRYGYDTVRYTADQLTDAEAERLRATLPSHS